MVAVEAAVAEEDILLVTAFVAVLAKLLVLSKVMRQVRLGFTSPGFSSFRSRTENNRGI